MEANHGEVTCIGANWMHDVSKQPEASQSHDAFMETTQRRFWSWLILCDDNTVISLHEDTGSLNNVDDLKSIRGNTLSVLRQISRQGYGIIDPLSVQSIRPALDLERPAENGHEGASNLFYYLFDDWRAVYVTAALFKKSLHELTQEVSILEDMVRSSIATRKSNESPDTRIIPRLHFLSKSIRQMHHLYKGYHSIILRLLEPPKGNVMTDVPANGSILSQTYRSGAILTPSASQRFERLGDRLQLMILSQTEELLAEKDGLSTTLMTSQYFNITSQKDSEATARLNRSAALLAKLSVLFLPVSLMTSYFSTQLSGIEGKYTFTDYWIGFAVVVSASFVCLFFFSRMLMWVTEILDSWFKELGKVLRHWIVSCLRGVEGRKNRGKNGSEAKKESEDE
ncbi:adp-ribosylation factor protein [Rutstroemia sp. NJR-2017a BBW]|nr:adp-ribosylation factor protein [Rutstroemia sp. NJR-2017a BBW]